MQVETELDSVTRDQSTDYSKKMDYDFKVKLIPWPVNWKDCSIMITWESANMSPENVKQKNIRRVNCQYWFEKTAKKKNS